MCVGCTCVCRYLGIFMGTQSWVSYSGIPSPSFQTRSLIGLELIKWSRLTSQRAPVILLSSAQTLQIHTTTPGIFTWVLTLNSGPHAHKVALPMELSLTLGTFLILFERVNKT